jgi:G3E family GTPase
MAIDLDRDQGVNAIESLMERRGAFDYILLETTGLADPGNIAPLFWVDEGLGSSIYLDGIVTVVDAKNILHSLDEPAPETQHAHDDHSGPALTTAHLQISHADVIVLNKSDLVTANQMLDVQRRIRAINSLAKIHMTSHSQVPELDGVLLDIHGYDSVKAEQLEFAAKGHSHLDPTISTLTIDVPPLNAEQLSSVDTWLQKVLWESKLPESSKSAFEIHRVKGRMELVDGTVRMVQGVRQVYDIFDASSKASGVGGKLVVIGRRLQEDEFKRSFKRSLDSPGVQ